MRGSTRKVTPPGPDLTKLTAPPPLFSNRLRNWAVVFANTYMLEFAEVPAVMRPFRKFTAAAPLLMSRPPVVMETS